jgi:hypothetical protein
MYRPQAMRLPHVVYGSLHSENSLPLIAATEMV